MSFSVRPRGSGGPGVKIAVAKSGSPLSRGRTVERTHSTEFVSSPGSTEPLRHPAPYLRDRVAREHHIGIAQMRAAGRERGRKLLLRHHVLLDNRASQRFDRRWQVIDPGIARAHAD